MTVTFSLKAQCTHIKYGGSILDSLVFLLYISDLLKATAGKATSVLFADDTGRLITSPNISQFQNDSNVAFAQINRWFNVNQLSINLEKTFYSLYK
jgi:hypothetical protein